MAATASTSKTNDFTELLKCKGCGRALYLKRSWNGLSVKCPRCGAMH